VASIISAFGTWLTVSEYVSVPVLDGEVQEYIVSGEIAPEQALTVAFARAGFAGACRDAGDLTTAACETVAGREVAACAATGDVIDTRLSRPASKVRTFEIRRNLRLPHDISTTPRIETYLIMISYRS